MKTFTVFRTVDFQTDIEAESKEEAYHKAEESLLTTIGNIA